MRKGAFKDKYSKIKINKKTNSYELHLDGSGLGALLDYAQTALDAQAWQDVQKYMPIDTGMLISETNVLNVAGTGEVWLYPDNHDYAHYLYEGELYVDPVYGKGAFYSPEYGFWSRPNVQKVPSGRPLTYQNPSATDHWGETAIQNHGSEWEALVQRILDSKG